jgi:hypothetical protein|tara:strand:- start:16798 stop:16977 length:180 start_codon:yes stop_codon:yes gene_type:complete
MGGFGGRRSAPAPAPRPPVKKKEAPPEAVRRKRLAEGRSGIQTTVGGDNTGTTKTLLGS